MADVAVLEWDLGLVIQEISTKRYVPKSTMLQLKKRDVLNISSEKQLLVYGVNTDVVQALLAKDTNQV